MSESILNPAIIAEKGEKIYQDKLKKKLEKKRLGEFVAIDIETEKHYLGKTAEEALEKARKEAPQKIFHLIKIGAEGIYNVSWCLKKEYLNACCF